MKIKHAMLLTLMVLKLSGVAAQPKAVTVSAVIKEKNSVALLPYANVVLKTAKDSQFVSGTITDDEGRFSFTNLRSGNYTLEISLVGYKPKSVPLFIGSLSEYLDLSVIVLEDDVNALEEVRVISSGPGEINAKMDKKTFQVADNITQSGGSVLQVMQNLPGVTVQDGKLQLRGNDRVAVLVDGKQTAMTGFGSQVGLDNIPASAIDRIEIVNNPSAKFDANGNAGIINIIYKKNKQEGFNGKAGIGSGFGALWERKANLPTIRPQYTMTPKVNPSLSLNYLKGSVNTYVQADYLYTETLNKNEFVTRTYSDGTVINQQTKRNRNTHFTTLKAGADWNYNDNNTLSFSGLFASERIRDNGDEPFFNANFTERSRLWQFLEKELKTTLTAVASWQHKYKEPGHALSAGINYTYHRENERYFFTNILPASTGSDAFRLLSDEKVLDLNLDYVKPLKYGKIEAGIKFRNRQIPTDMVFLPGPDSPIDASAGGKATYKELIPAAYSNYIFENDRFGAELGLRVEYVHLNYEVNPNHPVYHSDGYDYTQPFPNLRLSYKINEHNKLTAFYNRRVDRPNEVDIRIFPKYDDAEIIKVGNPALRPQFTSAFELGYKTDFKKGYCYASAYHRMVKGTITRVSTTAPGSNLIYAVFQNAGRSTVTGFEMVFSKEVASWYTLNLNGNAYQTEIQPFTVTNQYPVTVIYTAPLERLFSGNLKNNNTFRLNKTLTAQFSAVFLAPDIIPQGKVGARYYADFGIKKSIQQGKGELYLNATDIFNTLVVRKQVNGANFEYNSNDYYETQAVRFGYSCKF